MAQKTILAVEDDDIFAAYLKTALTDLGYGVVQPVATGEDAVAQTRAQKPDLILMDINLSGAMDGITAADHIQAFSQVPIIYLTGHSETPFLRKVSVAAYGYLVKPVSSQVLSAAIEMAFYRHAIDMKLRESEERLKLALASSHMGVWERNVATNGMFWSPECYDLFGLTDFGGTFESFANLLHPEDAPAVMAAIGQVSTDHPVFRAEFRIVCPDGGVRWLVSAGRGYFDGAGALLSMTGTVQDVTLRKEADDALRESEERYRIAIESSNDGIALSREGKHLFVNRRFLGIFGYDQEEAVHMESFAAVHPDDRERIREITAKRMRGDEVPSRYEFKGIRKDGTELDIAAAIAPVVYRGDHVSLVYFRDVTEAKKAEESLRESENTFRDLAEKAIVGVYLVQDGVFKYVNSRFAEIHGYEVDELIDRKGPQDTVVAEYIPELQKNMGRLLSGEIDFVRAQGFRMTTKQGETRNAEVHSTHTVYRGRRALIGTLLDVTERNITEEVLRWKTAFLEALLDTSSDGILVVDGQGKSILQNQRTVDLWKIPQEVADRKDDEAQARHVLSVVKDPDKFQQQALHLCSHPNESIRDEVELLDGRVIERHSSLVVGKDGTYYGRIFGFRDITEIRRYWDMLENLSTTDGLTELPNRRRFDEFLNREWRRAMRDRSFLSLIMMDIDFFKEFNDHYGHLAGDDCLRRIAQVLKDVVQRPGDLAARYGGEEFACILPETNSKGAVALAERIKERVKAVNIPHFSSLVADHVTLSFGVATMIPEGRQEPSDLIRLADGLLYAAKENGRDQVRGWRRAKDRKTAPR